MKASSPAGMPIVQRSISADVIVLDQRARALVTTNSHLHCLGSGTLWCEGPVWIARDQCLLFSDIPNNRMMLWDAPGGLRVWRDEVEFTNGHALYLDGSLLHCSHGERAIVRTRFGPRGVQGAGGPVDARDCIDEVLVDRYLGKRLNSPNDVIVKRDGSVWFTDPPYGILSNREGHMAAPEQSCNGVYCFDLVDPEASLRRACDAIEEPNGLAFSPDESVLYISDTSAALRTDGSGHHHIVACAVKGHELGPAQVVAQITPGLADGFRIDRRGWIFTSSESGVQVIHPDGTPLAHIPVPEKVGNLCFGGPHGTTLFICASTSLYCIELQARGAH